MEKSIPTNKIIPREFFNRPTLVVARDLIGKTLVRRIGRQTRRYKITEVEAYVGPHDLACHSSKGRTPRTEVMYGEAGRFYIYFIYGMYWMLNIITEDDCPTGILIRGVEGISGPGRVTRALSIDKTLKGKLAIPQTGLWFEDNGEKIPRRKIKRTPRIGVSYAGPEWSQKPYRFVLEE